MHNNTHSEHAIPYIHLALMTGLSFIAMYILMYSMVDRLGQQREIDQMEVILARLNK